MSKVEFCVCGSPMSIFEKDHYGKCTGCHQADEEEAAEEKKRQRQGEEEERKAAIQAKRLKAVASINRQLALLQGKTIQEAVVDSWSEIPFYSRCMMLPATTARCFP